MQHYKVSAMKNVTGSSSLEVRKVLLPDTILTFDRVGLMHGHPEDGRNSTIKVGDICGAADGLQPENSKIKALRDVEGFFRFVLNYYGKFITCPLC